MKIFYRPIIDRIKDDVFVLDQYDLFMIKAADADIFLVTAAILICAVIVSYLTFDKGYKKAGWISMAVAVISAIGLIVCPMSREKYLLNIANRNSLTTEEFKLIQTKLTEEANLRVPIKKTKR